MIGKRVRSWALATAGGVLLVAPSVRADIPPPEGYIETCTVEKKTTADTECVECGTYHGEPDKCKELHAADGYSLSCKTSGASVWKEVWCRAKTNTTPTEEAKPAAEVKPTEAKPTTDGAAAKADPVASKCAGADVEGSLGLIAALGILIGARRRKRLV